MNAGDSITNLTIFASKLSNSGGQGGGACIVDKYPKPGQKTGEGSLGQRQSAATEEASTGLN